MAIPVIESFNSGSGAGISATVTKPSGVVAGDLLVILAATDINSTTTQFIDDITGFNYEYSIYVNSSARTHIGLYWREATGSENASETVEARAGAANTTAIYLRISGADTTTPFHITGTATADAGGDTKSTASSLTTTLDDCLILSHVGVDRGDAIPITTATASWTLNEDVAAGSGGAAGSAVASRSLATAGASGLMEFSLSSSARNLNRQLAIAPASGVVDNAIFFGMNF